MVGKALEKDTGAALVAITAWLRFSAQRLLCWNKNYNVKPREISAAQSWVCSSTAGGNPAGLQSIEDVVKIHYCIALVMGGNGDKGSDVGQAEECGWVLFRLRRAIGKGRGKELQLFWVANHERSSL
eukprot:833126-Pelagomonas_calceolata.AAC.1